MAHAPAFALACCLRLRSGAAAAEVRRAYKKLALLYHPDKARGQGQEQVAAIADKFKQVGPMAGCRHIAGAWHVWAWHVCPGSVRPRRQLVHACWSRARAWLRARPAQPSLLSPARPLHALWSACAAPGGGGL